MRPQILNPLYAPLTTLPGIGQKLDKLFARLLETSDETGHPRIVDLLWHLPSGVIDRSRQPKLAMADPGVVATIKIVVDRHRPPPMGRSRAPYRVHCHDETGELTLVFFNASRSWVERSLPVGESRWVSGRVEDFGGQLQIVHPDYIVDDNGYDGLPLIEPTYPRTEGLGARVIARAAHAALDAVPVLAEWQDPAWIRQNKWPSFAEALHAVHRPRTPEDADAAGAPWSRLAYDELLAGQLALTLVRGSLRRAKGIARLGDGTRVRKIIDALPFALTRSQETAFHEIKSDLGQHERMLRLLQGDVGSGKTIVGLLAMTVVAEAGWQSALMAPTELLARQHLNSISALAETAGLRVALLTGREKGKERAAVLEAAASGRLDILVGTHAIFQAGVTFHRLGLVVVDEQHRFGVHQRLALTAKGEAADMLVMTATPIPRTLLLTHYGDMDATQLTEKPAGRQPVQTRTVPLDRLSDVVDAVVRAVSEEAQVYWVCPLVDDSETLEITSAEARFAALRPVLGQQVGLLHGRMSGTEKDAVMRRFVDGQIRVLVATTVIEVGVDVPQATIMVIENAERFGLAQLHQLRGRVGRGLGRSTCLLLYQPPLGEVARSRLAILRDTDDGFRIAEEDLRLRGGGEALGTRQSGMPGFRIVRPEIHLQMIEAARDDARLVLEQDPRLKGARGQALRTLLYLFGKDAAMRLVEAG